MNLIELMDNKVFVPGGRGPVEFDCWGFCREAYRQFGKDLPREYASPIDTKERALLVGQYANSDEFLEIPEVEIPCLVTIAIRPPFFSHIGVMITPTTCIHILEKVGVSTFNIRTHISWKNRIGKFYRFTGDCK